MKTLPFGRPEAAAIPAAQRLREVMDLPARGVALARALPFGPGDTTAGAENELQAAVQGPRQSVDLPRVIEQSNYYRNIHKRLASGELPARVLHDLERHLADNSRELWENSWVRVPLESLSPAARQVLEVDLKADKADPQSPPRDDAARFLVRDQGRELYRLPISYLLKLSLAEALGRQPQAPALIQATGRRLMEHFLSDNTSPETFSFAPVTLGNGQAIARETAKRFLLTQLLTQFASRAFGLTASGQTPLVYFAPSPPLRQKRLNDCISDSFYRELFMSPCLSGWDRGEDKHRYMHLCHQVLSRSQLNAVAKLKEAGIITHNLVVLPNLSNTCLANNGTHLSLGSRRLGALLADPASGFDQGHEKYFGDLVIKGVEHFLPLFVGAYSAAPTRLPFTYFHPERALAFLPHELDYTHLRMIWRRWRKKAGLKVLGRLLTPFGPELLDNLVARVFGLKGDHVPDHRLIDYLACLLSTPQSPALDGTPGNQARLKQDLSDLGIFDAKMALYLLYRQRETAVHGYSGFEGRHYSLFPSLLDDLAPAAALQNLVTALCWQYLAQGRLTHGLIPDDPVLESERRQIFFGAAIGLPTFFIRKDSPNLFLRMIVERARRVRASTRYPGYLRVHHLEYRRALLGLIREDAADLVEALGAGPVLADLEQRLEDPEHFAAAGRLSAEICRGLGAGRPLAVEAEAFNAAAEDYYRLDLKRRHLAESLDCLAADARRLDAAWAQPHQERRQALNWALGQRGAAEFVERVRLDLLTEQVGERELIDLINLTLISLEMDLATAGQGQNRATGLETEPEHAASVS